MKIIHLAITYIFKFSTDYFYCGYCHFQLIQFRFRDKYTYL